ncbi:MAG: hypothetical protein ABSF29_09540 [Tepidisphaeraceae bacterium]|jgi:hypothetical protein
MLAWAVLLYVVPIAAGYRLARRFSAPLQAIPDALLFAFLVQYVSVLLAGFLGVLSPLTLTLIALILTLPFLALPWAPAFEPLAPLDRAVAAASFCFLLGFLGAVIYEQRYLPPLATDSLAYHFPAAVQWLQHRRVDLFQTWFFNPANTYSPLAGSVFITWLLAPLGNDSLARFVQVGPLLLLFFALIEIARQTRAGLSLAALVALAAVLSRPFIAQSTLAKDDLFVAAFFAVIVANLSQTNLRHPLAPLRIGVALGLLLATKYTAILSAVLLILACDAPLRAGWKKRQWITAIAAVVLLAAPWFIRNCILTGNPLFPVAIPFFHLPSLFAAARSTELSTPTGIWSVLSGGYFAMPPLMWLALTVFWIVALIRSLGLLATNPQTRLILLGPPAGIALFILLAPYPEVRFIFPSLVLLFAAVPFAIPGRLQPLVLLLIGLSIATSFSIEHRAEITQFTLIGAVAVIIGLGLWRLDVDRLGLWKKIPRVTAALAIIAAFFALDLWPDYLAAYRQTTPYCYQLRYGPLAELWVELDVQAPPDATVAYSNQFMIYPLYGFDHTRRVIYAPLQRNLRLQDLRLPPKLSGEYISAAVTTAANRTVDRAAWLENLQSAGAQYLVVASSGNPPEISLADQDPRHFHPIFINSAGIIYRIAP